MGNINWKHKANNYTISNEGVIYKVEDDGSINKLAQVDNNGNVKIFSEQQSPSKSGVKGWCYIFIILFVLISITLGFLYLNLTTRYDQLCYDQYEKQDSIQSLITRYHQLCYDQYEKQDSIQSLIRRNDILEKELADVRSLYKNASMTINGHEYVDLGLPSGLKWATCNVGANSPDASGNYYAWGETSTKSSYTESNSQTYNRDVNDIGGHLEYDVAYSNWGGNWHLPSLSDFYELQNECEWIWSSYSGVSGYIVKSKRNGNYIFLPITGYMYGSGLVSGNGYYWSSTPNSSKNTESYFLVFNEKDGYWCSSVTDSRPDGMAVRPVAK